MSHAPRLLVILLVEAACGYPARWRHPVEFVGWGIDRAERRWNRGSPRQRRLIGSLMVAGLVGSSLTAGRMVERFGACAAVLAGTTGLAQRSLFAHVAAVEAPLAAGDLPAARLAVARVVGRDTAALDEAGVATAAIETLAESFCDGVVAPAFWYGVGGLPGLFAAKAINTADSMVGHRDERHARFGWASARADDVVNWVPARLSGLAIALVGGGFRTMLRDARRHASPNGGWPEAAMAGALGRTLGGPVRYDGEPAERAWLGEGPPPDAGNIRRALRVYLRACLVLWTATGVLAWAR